MVSPPGEGGLKESIYAENNIIISDSTLRNILPPQLNKWIPDNELKGCGPRSELQVLYL